VDGSQFRSIQRVPQRDLHLSKVNLKKTNNFFKDSITDIKLHKSNSDRTLSYIDHIQNKRLNELNEIIKENKYVEKTNILNKYANCELDENSRCKDLSNINIDSHKSLLSCKSNENNNSEHYSAIDNNHVIKYLNIKQEPKEDLMITLNPMKFKCDIWTDTKDREMNNKK